MKSSEGGSICIINTVTGIYQCFAYSIIIFRGGYRISTRVAGTFQGEGEAPTYDFAKFSQNYMKLKEFGPTGGIRSAPLDLPLILFPR